MQTITQREFDDDPAAVMAAVANGETYIVTRDGVEVVELRSLNRRREITSAELVARARRLPRVDYEEMRREADEFFGENRIGDDDPWERTRGRA
ncbi:type II toxin-antitoxin system Phd/YefM family antitoxin [Glycomyces dulcitolivorans]|uniref:type II toxin-antitoxin system Phd/YefM family antitoxin n=1 Tax=Glycomyces dulcitolivorans TaxID=2200759 RepID=UPI000DD44A6D|nr:PhdYeFM domain-containing protein [Glycomyces dulcitolivorans]